jgi:hypothetical protein
MPDREVIEFPGRRGAVLIEAANETTHLSADVLEQAVDLLIGALDDEFDSTVGEVFDIAIHVIPHGEVFDGIAKTDTLNAATEVARTTAIRGSYGRWPH